MIRPLCASSTILAAQPPASSEPHHQPRLPEELRESRSKPASSPIKKEHINDRLLVEYLLGLARPGNLSGRSRQ